MLKSLPLGILYPALLRPPFIDWTAKVLCAEYCSKFPAKKVDTACGKETTELHLSEGQVLGIMTADFQWS